MIRRLAIIISVLVACGCASEFAEQHFFKSRTSGQEIPNYYRLTVSGYSFISSSRYLSGYFDEDTLNAYFGEFTQPPGGALVSSSKPSRTEAPEGEQNAQKAEFVTKGAVPGNGRKLAANSPEKKPPAKDQKKASIEPVGPNFQGKRLFLILSSNSDAVAAQISALASSKQFTASLAGLLARDKYNDADTATSRLTIESSSAKTTASLASQVIAKLDEKPDDAEAILREFINRLASDLGSEGTFLNLDNAERWLHFNRARLLRGER